VMTVEGGADVRANGRKVEFQISPDSVVFLPAGQPFFVKGTILNGEKPGVITIDNPYLKERIVLDMHDWKTPKRDESAGTPTTRNGTVSGTIRWKKSQGHPQISAVAAYGDALLITAEVTLGPPKPGDFEGPTAKVGVLDRTFVEAGDYYECRYIIKNLPVGVPLNVTVAFDKMYRWVAGSDSGSSNDKSFEPRGGPGFGHLVLKESNCSDDPEPNVEVDFELSRSQDIR